MKHMLKTIVKTVKSVKGNSLAEFATTTALMATLAATAAPKLSEMSEGAKGEKSRNEIDKIVKQAGSFYQDIADLAQYGIGVANNGGGTDGQEYTFPEGSATAGQHILIARSLEAMESYGNDRI